MHLETVCENLIRRGFAAACFDTASDCADYLNRSIDQTTVGIGGSVTVAQLDLLPRLRAHNTVYWHNDPDQLRELGDKAIRTRAMDTDVYIASANGLSEAGEIVNIDYTGNRIASLCYGHRKVYIVVGKNKIAPDRDQALLRARNIAAPKNAQRLHMKTPCAVKGDRCYDCSSPNRLCRGVLILERAMFGMDTEVLLVNEDLGY